MKYELQYLYNFALARTAQIQDRAFEVEQGIKNEHLLTFGNQKPVCFLAFYQNALGTSQSLPAALFSFY